jgi:hypothetical protein
VDLDMWFRWKDPDIDPSRSFEFMNAFELWGHILTYETEEPEKLPDGSLYFTAAGLITVLSLT